MYLSVLPLMPPLPSVLPNGELAYSGGVQPNVSMQSLWPYNTYRPVTWDKYYVNEYHDKQPSVSSGVAAGVTIGIFFMVFVFTFGCRIYSQYVDRGQEQAAASRSSETAMSESIADDMWICGRPLDPPPPYEIAISMPSTMPTVPAAVHV